MMKGIIIKKLVTPLTYSVLAIPTFFIAITILSFYESVIGLHSVFGRQGDLESVTIFIIVTGVIMCLGNYLIQRIERLSSPRLVDHIRQSSLYYLASIFMGIPIIISFVKNPISQCQEDCFVYMFGELLLIIPLTAILVNALMLYRKYNSV